MSSPLLFAALLALSPQFPRETVDELLAPILDANGVAAVCFAPARWQAGERSRECQHRLLREEGERAARQGGLRSGCERAPLLAGETLDGCMRRVATTQFEAREARHAERRAEIMDEVDSWLSEFDQALDAAPARTQPVEPPAPEPAPAPRRGCRRETTRNPDGSGGSVAWVCGDAAALAPLREALRPF